MTYVARCEPGRFARMLLSLCLALFLTIGVAPSVACAQQQAADRVQPESGAGAFPKLAETLAPADFGAEAIVIVHYHRGDRKFGDWNLWSWAEGAPGAAFEFKGQTPFGRYAVVPLASRPESVGLIVRKGNWVSKDIDRDRFVRFPAGKNVAEIWLVSGDETVYLDPATVDLSVKPVNAFLDAPDTIIFSASAPLEDAQLAGLRVFHAEDKSRSFPVARSEGFEERGATRALYRLTLAEPVAAADLTDLRVKVPGSDKVLTVYARNVLTAPAFTPLDAKLGYDTNAARTRFTTWSPVADRVELVLYGNARELVAAGSSAAKPVRAIALTRGEKGLWTAEVPGDLHLSAYRYRFHSYGHAREVPDIHTFGATYDSAFSVVLDLARLQPPEWGTVPQPVLARPTDEIISEVHVRDFSIRDASVPEKLRGTYLALARENPAQGPATSTGLSHLRDLGVTGVHLLPIHDFTAAIGEYNWGYWTALFNVPEANYATDPKDPAAAPMELRAAIQGLHRAGIRVILDVVYNHTSTSFEHSPFDQTVPFYYFRTSSDGRLLNDAGVGNSFADERPMARKYIADSAEFWVRQYRVDGFRFDLLGTHHPETVKYVTDRLLAVRPDLTLYGEPWTGGGPTHFPKGAQRGMRMAVFNDHIRGAIRGDLDGTAPGFVTGTEGHSEDAIRRGVMGAIDDFTDSPVETINYASAHDNLTFWDKLLITRPEATDEQRRAMQKLAHGIVLTSQGIAFIHGGCEFARTKGGNHNSYNAGDDVNLYDWPRKAAYADVFDYVRGLVSLRKAHPAFRMANADEVRKSLAFLPTGHGVVAYTLDADASGGASAGTTAVDPRAAAASGVDTWDTILVAYNGATRPHPLTLPAGNWTVVVDDKTAGITPLRTVEGKVELPGSSMIVMFQTK